jgi:hypothetical protein
MLTRPILAASLLALASCAAGDDRGKLAACVTLKAQADITEGIVLPVLAGDLHGTLTVDVSQCVAQFEAPPVVDEALASMIADGANGVTPLLAQVIVAQTRHACADAWTLALAPTVQDIVAKVPASLSSASLGKIDGLRWAAPPADACAK